MIDLTLAAVVVVDQQLSAGNGMRNKMDSNWELQIAKANRVAVLSKVGAQSTLGHNNVATGLPPADCVLLQIPTSVVYYLRHFHNCSLSANKT